MLEGLAGVSNLLVSLGHTGSRVALGHTLNTQTLTKTKKSHNVLSKFKILCWAAFIGPSWTTCGPWAAGWTPPGGSTKDKRNTSDDIKKPCLPSLVLGNVSKKHHLYSKDF